MGTDSHWKNREPLTEELREDFKKELTQESGTNTKDAFLELPKSPGRLDEEFAESLNILESVEHGLTVASDMQHRTLMKQTQRQREAFNRMREEEMERNVQSALERGEMHQRMVSENLASSLARGVEAAQSDIA